jgi:hypothetical protein
MTHLSPELPELQTVEGHVQGITTPEGQDNQSVPLPHASHGPAVAPQRLRLPHSGEDLQPPPVAPAQAGAYHACRSRQTHVIGTCLRWCDGVFCWMGYSGDDAQVTGIP